MVRSLVSAGLLALTSNAAAVDPAVSGLWYNPAQNGHGFEITVVAPGTATVTWYTFSPFRGPIWLAGVLEERSPGVLSGSLDYYDGMRFGTFVPSEATRYPWGTMTFALAAGSCSRATVSYSGTLTYQTGEGFGSGSIPVEKLAGVSGLECGGSQPTAPNGLAGVYFGNVTSNLAGGTEAVHVAVDAAGEFVAVIPDRAVFRGRLTGESSISASFTAIPVTGLTFPSGATFTATGTARAGDFIAANFAGSGESGSISAYLLGTSTRGYSLSRMAGSYVDATGATGFSGTLSTSGAFSGADRFGCRFAGTLPQQLTNPISLSVQVSGCAAAGSYTGKAIIADWFSAGDGRALVLGLASGNAAISTIIRR